MRPGIPPQHERAAASLSARAAATRARILDAAFVEFA